MTKCLNKDHRYIIAEHDQPIMLTLNHFNTLGITATPNNLKFTRKEQYRYSAKYIKELMSLTKCITLVIKHRHFYASKHVSV